MKTDTANANFAQVSYHNNRIFVQFYDVPFSHIAHRESMAQKSDQGYVPYSIHHQRRYVDEG